MLFPNILYFLVEQIACLCNLT